MSVSSGKGFAAGVILFAALAGFGWWLFFRGNSAMENLRAAATRMLAEHLAQSSPAAVLVVSNPFAEMSGRPREVYDSQNAALAGLKKGFAGKTKLIVAPAELTPEAKENPAAVPIDPNSKTPLSFLVAEGSFDQLLAAHPDCNLVISLIGVPVNLSRVQAWSNPGNPRFALLLPDWRMIGGADAILHAFRSGKLVAAIVENPTANPQEPYLLITGKNAPELAATHPGLFAP